ncbi:MAG: winged helix-turn-helix domain-containing protein [Actinomycetes bacterium]|jgi:DNA-binding transcriptional ArsR family regulator
MKTNAAPLDLDLVFDALGNAHRREIISMLGLQPVSISDLALQRKISLQAIHKHVNLLVEAGMVTRKKSGRVTFLTLNRASMRGIQDWVTKFQAHWDGGTETLENYAQTVEFKKKLKKKKEQK